MNLLESMFEWLLATTLRASVMAVAILALQLTLRRWLPPQWRHALWMPMLLVLALPVLPKVPFGFFPQKAAVVETATTTSALEIATTAADALPAAPPPAEATRAKLNPWAITWLAGTLIVLGVGIASYRRNMRRILQGIVPLGDGLCQVIDSAAREVKLRHVPRILASTAVESPAVTGLVEPCLLLPAGFPAGFRKAETRLILLHEFTHLKRRDLPLNWLTCIFQAMHWFNPILWFAFARMRADRESACDAQVLSLDQGKGRSEYGHALLKLQSVTPRSGLQLGFVGIFESSSELKTRIREISNHRKSHPAWRAGGLTMIGVLTLFGATKAQEPQKEKAPEVTRELVDPPPQAAPGTEAIFTKLKTIVIPVVKFENTSLEEAVDFLRTKSKELDKAEQDAAKKGVNFVIRRPRGMHQGVPDPGKTIVTLDLKNVTMISAMTEIAKQTKLRFIVDEFAVTFVPADDKPRFQNLPPGVDVDQLGDVDMPPPPEPRLPKGKAAQAASKIIIPTVEFEDVSLTEAVASLNQRAKESAKGQPVFPVVLDPKVDGTIRIKELRLRNVPLFEAIRYMSQATKTVITASDTEVRITKP